LNHSYKLLEFIAITLLLTKIQIDYMILANKRILITGATSGIGRSLAIKLAKQGAQLAVCGRSEEKMQALIKELALHEKSIFSRTFSVTDEYEIIRFVKDASNVLGGIDILINNAGVNPAKNKVAEIKTEDFDLMVAVNMRAPFIFMREVFNIMKGKKTGTVVNILSSVCLSSNETMGAYTASKAGIDALTKVFRKEARKEGIKVFGVYPGGVNTPFRTIERTDYMSPDSVADTIIPMLSLPDDVAVHDLVFRPMVEDNF
jgi:NAD(P)-dependent dehydrogenase (short-subunit alcohol dehydrogenase family)